MATVTPLSRQADGADEAPPGPTVRRTRAGNEEFVVLRNSLTDVQLQVLLHANGKRPFEAIAAMVPAVAEDRASLDQLRRAGLIELVDPELGEVIDGFAPAASDTPGQAETPHSNPNEAG